MFKTLRSTAAIALAACTTLICPGSLRASPAFPGVVQAQFGLTYLPDCTLCHRDDSGGRGTVVRPFGVSVMRFGARAGDTASLIAALQEIERQGTDSNGDGRADVEQLVAHEDPNLGGSNADTGPQHGCGVSAGSRSGVAGASLTALLLAAGFARSRRRTALNRRVPRPLEIRHG